MVIIFVVGTIIFLAIIIASKILKNASNLGKLTFLKNTPIATVDIGSFQHFLSIIHFIEIGSPSSTDGRRRKNTYNMNMQENGDSVPQWAIPTPKLSFLDRVGVAIETCLTKFFTIWGTNCSRYPLPVIIVSVVIAGSLCSGIQWLEVTTDPIELWASPTSRSRIEKDFFDSTFRPFYRTQQIIVKARNLDSVSFGVVILI